MESSEYNNTARSDTSEESGDSGSVTHRVVDSTSYTVPGNPLASYFDHRITSTPLVPYEPLAPIPRQKPLIQHGMFGESFGQRESRRDTCTPSRREHETKTPSLHGRESKLGNGFKLPEIHPCKHARSEDVLESLSKEGILPESKFIRHTRSGIAYHYMYGPPVVRRPRRLPRIVSEGAVRTGQDKFLVDTLDHRVVSPRKRYCSGGRFTEDIRNAALTRRQEREKKNAERVRRKLQQQNDQVAMLTRGHVSTPRDDRGARIQEVRAKQQEIRQQEAMRAMENFMRQKRK